MCVASRLIFLTTSCSQTHQKPKHHGFTELSGKEPAIGLFLPLKMIIGKHRLNATEKY